MSKEKYQQILRGILAQIILMLLMFSPAAIADIIHAETQIEEQNDSAPLHLWTDPDNSNKGIIILVHGLSQHAESLDSLARILADEGFFILAIDQRGHGNWHRLSRKSKKGYYCDYKNTVNDLDQLITDLKPQAGGLPIFLLGESIGASVVLRAAVRNPDKVQGIILCSCAGKIIRPQISWLLRDAADSLLKPGKEISIARYQNAYACENKEVVAKSLADYRSRSGFRAREVIGFKKFFSKNSHFVKRLDSSTDLLLLAGAEEKLIKPAEFAKFLATASSQNKSLVLVPNRGHMMIGRTDISPDLKSNVCSWLNKEVSKQVAVRHEELK